MDLANAEVLFGLEYPYGEADIKKKYRELVKKYHPDKGGDTQMFLKVSEANEILKKDGLKERNISKKWTHYSIMDIREVK